MPISIEDFIRKRNREEEQEFKVPKIFDAKSKFTDFESRVDPVELEPRDEVKQEVIKDKDSFMDKLRAGREKVKKFTDFLSPEESDIKDKEAFNKTGIGFTKDGVLATRDPKSGEVVYTDVLGGVGSMKNVVKQGLDKIGSTLLKNIKRSGIKDKTGKVLSEAKDIVTEKAKPFIVDDYIKENIAKREAAQKAEGVTSLGRIRNFYKDSKRKLVDSLSPIEDVLNTAEKTGKFTILPEKDFRLQADRVLRSTSIAGQFVRDKGFDQVIREVPSVNKLDQYLIAKQAKKVAANGIETGRDLAKDQLLIDTLGKEYEPFAQKVTKYSQDLLDEVADAGLIAKELAAKLKKVYPDYVPLNRVFNELEASGGQFGSKAVASLSDQNIVKRLKGSKREIENPIESIMQKTSDAWRQIEKNKAARMLAESRNLPGNPLDIKKITENTVRDIKKDTISFINNGVKETYEVPKDIATAAKSLDVQQLNIIGKVMQAPVRLAKVGITGMNPSFILANVVRDQQLAAITSRNSFKTSIAHPVNFAKSLFEALRLTEKGKQGFSDLVRSGSIGTSFDVARDQIPQTVKKIRASRNVASNIKHTITHPGELFRAVEDIVGRSEELTRLQQFNGTKEALMKKGASERNATLLAAKAARENTANFLRSGEWGRVLNGAFLYLNAGVQGARSLVRSLEREPKKTAAKIATTLFMPMATITAWNMKDDDKREVYNDIPEYEKENNFIIIPDNVTQDENGKWNIIKIPMPAGVSQLTIPLRRMIEGVEDKEMLKSIVNSVSPVDMDKPLASLIPQAVKPFVQYQANMDFFTGYNTLSYQQQQLSPEKQAKPGTGGTARLVGEQFGISPAKTEKFVQDSMGELGLNLVNLTDRVLAGLDIIPDSQIGGRSFSESIIRRFKKAGGGATGQDTEDKLVSLLESQADESYRLKTEAEAIREELSSLPKETANAKAQALKKADPQLYKELKNSIEDEKLGLSYEDKLIKRLGVTNGARAEFIFEMTKDLETKEEKNAYIKELKRKKIITKKVLEQLKKKISNRS